jgi:hypothetical protein
MTDPDTPEPNERPDGEVPDTSVPDESGAGYGNHGDADD